MRIFDKLKYGFNEYPLERVETAPTPDPTPYQTPVLPGTWGASVPPVCKSVDMQIIAIYYSL